MSRGLYVFGGWPGHTPYEIANWTMSISDELGLELETSNDIFTLQRDLSIYDVIVLGWNNALTTEDLTEAQENSLLDAVSNGTGLVGWHGAGAAFRSSLKYSLLLGGSFLEHPAGEAVRYPYSVRILDQNHVVTRQVQDFSVESEQYFMQVDSLNHVLAETEFDGKHLPWLQGVKMPVAWVREWGMGRVFYCSIGHFIEDLEVPSVRLLMKQGLNWAVRGRI